MLKKLLIYVKSVDEGNIKILGECEHGSVTVYSNEYTLIIRINDRIVLMHPLTIQSLNAGQVVEATRDLYQWYYE